MNTNLPPRLQSEQTQQQQAYYQKMEAQMARWRADIVTLEAEMAQADVAEQLALQKQLDALKTKVAQAEERLDKMKDVTGDAWTELQAKVDGMQQEIAEFVEQAQHQLHPSETRS